MLSPLVDIRSRLVNRARHGAVRRHRRPRRRTGASAGSREFDGNTWGLPDRSLEDVDGELSEPAPGSTENRQEITIAALRGNLVPGAAEPVRRRRDGAAVERRDVDAACASTGTSRPATRSRSCRRCRASAPTCCASTPSSSPPDPIYLELPADFPQSVSATAVTVTAGQPTMYDKMMALQDWFRSEFQYSLDVPQGHSNSAIEAFLRQRIGYCEQFAGTFAAMARSLGIPARVAVGYTPGLRQGDGSRQVLGKNAHAWPEIWFDGLGWVPFEPTPGRGEPGAEDYTGVARGPGRVGARPGHRRRR